MKYMLPTQHNIYFGIQVKKGKLDSSGVTKGSNANIAEIHNQVLMMLGHEIFEPRNWQRTTSQIMLSLWLEAKLLKRLKTG
jgi:hypothetical protein